MRKNKLVKGVLSLAMATSLFCASAVSAFAEDVGNYQFNNPDKNKDVTISLEELQSKFDNRKGAGKTVILSTNDNHGAIQDFAHVASLKKYLSDQGADVILVDSGDFGQDKKEKSLDGKNQKPADNKLVGHLKKPSDAARIMNVAGYDIACLGNHEFDYGLSSLKELLEEAQFNIIDANIKDTNKKLVDKDGKSLYSPNCIEEVGSGDSKVKIGFFGLDTIEAQETDIKNNWGKDNKAVTIESGDRLYEIAEAQINELKDADIIVLVSHLGLESQYAPGAKSDKTKAKKGIRSADIYNAFADKIDLVLDGHSHTSINGGENNAPIMSTGIWSKYVGITIIDNSSKAIEGRYLISDSQYEQLAPDTATQNEIDKLVGNNSKDKSGKDKNSDKNNKNNKNNKNRKPKSCPVPSI